MKRISAYLLIVMNILFTATNSNAMINSEKKEPMQIPINIPFDITKSGNKAEVLFKIEKSDKYVFGIKFYENNKSRESSLKKRNRFLTNGFVQYVRLFTSVGYSMIKDVIFPSEPVTVKASKPSRFDDILGYKFHYEDGKIVESFNQKAGVQVPMKLKLYKYKIDQFGEEELVLDEESEVLDYQYIASRVIDAVELSTGVYKVEIEAINDNPRLDGFLTDLVISSNRYMIGNEKTLEKQLKINFKK